MSAAKRLRVARLRRARWWRFETQWLAATANHSALTNLSGQWIDLVHGRRPPGGIVLDMDSSVSPTHGEQEDSIWNGHYASRDDLSVLFKPLRGIQPALTADIEALFDQLGSTADGTLTLLPDLAKRHGAGLNTALRLLDGNREDQLRAVEALWLLLGKHVKVRKDGVYGQTMLDYGSRQPPRSR